MSVEKMHNGGWHISTIKNGNLVSRRYFGYTRKEAVAIFKAELRDLFI